VRALIRQPQHDLYKHPAFDVLIENRGVFSSRAAYDAFAGYASAQIQRLIVATASKGITCFRSDGPNIPTLQYSNTPLLHARVSLDNVSSARYTEIVRDPWDRIVAAVNA